MTTFTLRCFPGESMALTLFTGPDATIAGTLDWFTASALASFGVRLAQTER